MTAISSNGAFFADACRGTRNLYRALATYHSRNAVDPATRTYWERLINPGKATKRPYPPRKPPAPVSLTKSASMVEKACKLAGITREQLLSPSRKPKHAYPRFAICGTIHKHMPSLSLGQIARVCARTDHSFTAYCVKRYRELLETDEAFRALCIELEKLV